MECPVSSIINLPNEIVSLILVNNDPRDIISFGATCKQFHELVSKDDLLWKKKFSQTLPNVVVKLIKEHKNGKWLRELINFYNLKQNLCTEIISMPAEYHRVKEVSLSDVGIFFMYATQNNLNYYYTIFILQEIVKKGNAIIDTQQCLKPLYTLTTVYYAKIVLRHVLHTYLAVKWLQKDMRSELTPQFVINFFVQWTDVTKIYSDEDVDKKIELLVTRVKDFLDETHSKSKLKGHVSEKNKFTERQIVHAIYKVVFSNQHKVCTEADTDTLNIVKVIDRNYGHIISYAVIYQAVAKRFGLNCKLKAFPNHLFLEWYCRDELDKLYTIDLPSGEIKPKTRCPYSRSCVTNIEYCPDSFLRYIITVYLGNAGYLHNCEHDNAILLGRFLAHDENNRILNYYEIKRYAHSQPIVTTLNLTYLEDEQMEMILEISGSKIYPRVDRNLEIKRRHKAIKYAVGMVCYHNVYHYNCVIRGWQVGGAVEAEGVLGILLGPEEAFYYVTAADHSERMVAQENLNVVLAPLRLKNLEDRLLAREFTHFDGMVYVPNEQKLLEYPDEERYIEAFRRSSFVNSTTWE